MNVSPDVRSQSTNSLAPELIVLRYQVMNIAPDVHSWSATTSTLKIGAIRPDPKDNEIEGGMESTKVVRDLQ